MIKFSTIFLLSIMAGMIQAQTRTFNQVSTNQVAGSASSYSSGHGNSSSYSTSVGTSQSLGSGRTSDYGSHSRTSETLSSTPSYSGRGYDNSSRALYAENGNTAGTFTREVSAGQRFDLPRQETAILVFKPQPLNLNDKANGQFREVDFDRLVSVSNVPQICYTTIYGDANPNTFQHSNYNPFYQSDQHLQNCDNNREQFSFTCSLTGLKTGYLSNHRCNACVGYFHYWRTYTNYGCFEYINSRINKVQSISELKALIQSYYDCIDYYDQYNVFDPNTRARFRYGVGH